MATAQMPGTPVLQNAFANPGITGAVNFSSLQGTTSYAAAGAWAPGSARFQFSAGAGVQTHTGQANRTVYGARLNVPVFGADKSLGASVFVGWGALSGGTMDSTVAKAVLPVGATVSYRLALGQTRGISIYGSPLYESITRGGGAARTGVFRGAVGLDVGITSSIGLTLGMDMGKKEPAESGKPSGTAFGAAVSYALSAGR
jgi:hypothetical protein